MNTKYTAVLSVILLIAAATLLFSIVFAPANNTGQSTFTTNKESQPQPDTTLSLSPQTINLSFGTEFIVDVMIDTGTNKITAAQVELGYDPELITVTKTNAGSFIPQALTLLNENNPQIGRFSYAIGLPPSLTAVNGQGKLLSVTIKLKDDAVIKESQSAILVLPKSLISSVGIEKSMLKSTSGAALILPAINPPTITQIQPVISSQ